jgi:hypothetical protein
MITKRWFFLLSWPRTCAAGHWKMETKSAAESGGSASDY